MREVWLCQLPFLDIDYNNVIDFISQQGRDNFFKSKIITSISSHTKFDYEKQTLTVPLPISELISCDYIVINNSSNKMFYFIIKKETINNNNTTLHLKLDVWTTYMFDYKLLPSFVERCHQDRSFTNIFNNTVDEGLPLGDYIVDDVEEVYQYKNGLIIASTQPLGVIEEWTPNTSLPPSAGVEGGVTNGK